MHVCTSFLFTKVAFQFIVESGNPILPISQICRETIFLGLLMHKTQRQECIKVLEKEMPIVI